VSESARPRWKQLSEEEEFDALCAARLGHPVWVKEPLVLVSQVQRSGGTLLSQLFDGHPECHAHPQELKIGHPKKWNWPELDPARPEESFAKLYESVVSKHLARGYRKGPQTDDVFPFLFSPRLQWGIFERALDGGAPDERAVLDAYFTAYFNAWIDNQNLYTGPKRVVTGFTPRLLMIPESLEGYLGAYPDGTLVSIVRDPRGWYASASRHKGGYQDLDAAVATWRRSVEAALGAREQDGDRVLVLTYEELVRDPETVMRRVAERIGISWSPVLLEPTFNGGRTRSNSVEAAERQYGVSTDRVDAYRRTLEPATIDRIDELAGDLYERASSG
jgi:LPS sulfotransferase NodH